MQQIHLHCYSFDTHNDTVMSNKMLIQNSYYNEKIKQTTISIFSLNFRDLLVLLYGNIIPTSNIGGIYSKVTNMTVVV